MSVHKTRSVAKETCVWIRMAHISAYQVCIWVQSQALHFLCISYAPVRVNPKWGGTQVILRILTTDVDMMFDIAAVEWVLWSNIDITNSRNLDNLVVDSDSKSSWQSWDNKKNLFLCHPCRICFYRCITSMYNFSHWTIANLEN